MLFIFSVKLLISFCLSIFKRLAEEYLPSLAYYKSSNLLIFLFFIPFSSTVILLWEISKLFSEDLFIFWENPKIERGTWDKLIVLVTVEYSANNSYSFPFSIFVEFKFGFFITKSSTYVFYFIMIS